MDKRQYITHYEPKPCIVCKTPFTPESHNTKTCSPKCKAKRANAYNVGYRRRREIRLTKEGVHHAHVQRIMRERAKKRGVRTCLGCDKEFDSLGPFNRFCKKCQPRIEGFNPNYYKALH